MKHDRPPRRRPRSPKDRATLGASPSHGAPDPTTTRPHTIRPQLVHPPVRSAAPPQSRTEPLNIPTPPRSFERRRRFPVHPDYAFTIDRTRLYSFNGDCRVTIRLPTEAAPTYTVTVRHMQRPEYRLLVQQVRRLEDAFDTADDAVRRLTGHTDPQFSLDLDPPAGADGE